MPGKKHRDLRGRADAARALRAAARALDLGQVDLGAVRGVPHGLSDRAFAARVTAKERRWRRTLCVALPPKRGPARDVEPQRRILAHLAELELPIRVPRIAVVVHLHGVPVLVREHLHGFPADLRSRGPGDAPWRLVAQVAAAIHRIPIEDLDGLPGHATCREHGEQRLAELAPLADRCAEVRHALAWMRAHLPPDEPARLVQGGLVGRNLLLATDAPPGVPDWSRAQRGDPAHDLAHVTRGARRPFQVGGGLRKLLEEYAGRSGIELSEERVRFHELALRVDAYRSAIEGGVQGVLRNERVDASAPPSGRVTRRR